MNLCQRNHGSIFITAGDVARCIPEEFHMYKNISVGAYPAESNWKPLQFSRYAGLWDLPLFRKYHVLITYLAVLGMYFLSFGKTEFALTKHCMRTLMYSHFHFAGVLPRGCDFINIALYAKSHSSKIIWKIYYMKNN